MIFQKFLFLMAYRILQFLLATSTTTLKFLLLASMVHRLWRSQLFEDIYLTGEKFSVQNHFFLSNAYFSLSKIDTETRTHRWNHCVSMDHAAWWKQINWCLFETIKGYNVNFINSMHQYYWISTEWVLDLSFVFNPVASDSNVNRPK